MLRCYYHNCICIFTEAWVCYGAYVTIQSTVDKQLFG